MRKFSCNTSVTIPEKQLKLFRELKENGYFPSVSAIIRFCINLSLPRLIKEIKQLDYHIRNGNQFDIIKTLQSFGFTISKNRQTILTKPILSMIINGKSEVIQ